MNSRKNYFFVLLIFCSLTLSAQNESMQNLPRFDNRTIHFGFTLGFNQMNFSVDRNTQWADTVLSILPKSQWGFQIGIISDLRLASHFNLRFVPSLSFGDRTLSYTLNSSPNLKMVYNKTAESTFLDFPLYFKYKTDRLTNVRAYALFGGRYSYDLASQSKKKGDEELLLKINPHNIYAEAGAGVDFYLEYFKFGIELKMSYGINDVITRDGTIFSESISSLRSKIFWLSFTFE